MDWVIIIGVPLYISLGIGIMTLQMIPFKDLEKFKTPTGKLAIALLGIFITLFFPIWLVYVSIKLANKNKITKRTHDAKRDYVLRQLDKAHIGKTSNIPENIPRPHRAQSEFMRSKSKYVLGTSIPHSRPKDRSQ